MGIANSLTSLVIPDAGGEVIGEDPAGGESPTEAPAGGISVSAIGAPVTVASGEIANIGLEGSGEVYLVASDGYFLATGETGIVISAGSAVDWQAPVTDGDLEVTFGAYRLADDARLAETSTTVHGIAAEAAADTPVDIQCPATASASMEARVALYGSGGVAIASSSGYWPVETPNTDFQPDMDGGAIISGGLGAGSTITLSWMAPDDVGSATIAVTDSEGNEVDSCSIEIVGDSGAGDLGAPPPGADGQAWGDGTGISEADSEVVAQIMANPIGFAGDASGGPEANGPDYGYVDEEASSEGEAESASSSSRTPASSSARTLSESPDAKLGPASGADGMYAITLGTEGGKLISPYGATVIVPRDCLKDQTTVMIKPVDDKSIPETSGISTVPGTAFDVAFGAADGRAVDDLDGPALLTIALQSASMSENARIYKVEGNALTLMPLTDSNAGSISTEIDGLARYVVGVPQGATAASTSSINPFLIGGLGLIALASAGLLISRGLSRRKPRLIPARRPSNSRVRYR
jgi:hypothetical protein